MEKITLLVDSSTVEMLHLLARKSEKTIGVLIQEMALERYMQLAVDAVQIDNDLPASNTSANSNTAAGF